MRLNLFQYKVQDRDYTPNEVTKLINHCLFTHSILAGEKQSFLTLGSSIETFNFLFFFGTALTSAMAGITSISTLIFSTLFINHLVASVDQYKNEDNFTGKEITSFLNKHYDTKIYFNPELSKNIIDDFLNHRFLDSDVPLSSNAGLFDFSIATFG